MKTLLMTFAGTLALVTLIASPTLGDDVPPPLPKDSLPKQIDLKSVPLGLDRQPASPKDNLPTQERVSLGRKLFFDPVLSADGTVSCATCHRPDHGFASPEPIALGIKGRKGTRNAPSLLNRGLGTTFFWDGRAESLEAQAIKPIVNEVELGNTYENLLTTLRSDKRMVDSFATAFEGGGPETLVTKDNIGRALAAFQRTLLIGNSPIDAFQAGNHAAMTTHERQGFWLFESRGGCWKCHSGVNYSDEQFHNTGVSFGTEKRDVGRFEVTKKAADRFAFKTPTLRGVAHTAPYMHDGSLKTLKDVVEFYNKGGAPNDELLDRRMEPLGLSEKEVDLLVVFLKALSRDVDSPTGADSEKSKSGAAAE